MYLFKENFTCPKEQFSLNPSFENSIKPGPEVIKLFSCSTQLSTKILLINIKIPTTVGILTFISMINTTSERPSSFVGNIVFMSS